MKKKLLALFTTLALMLSLMPTAMAEGTTECNGTCAHAAAIGNTHYDTLQKACDAAKDGDTITLLSNIKFTKETAFHNNDWYDGVKYTGDQNFTIDLNGNTISDDGDLNDYLLYFMNTGSKANEITLKNGTISGGANLWAVLTVGASSAEYPTTLNLGTDLSVNGNGSGNSGEDCVAKSRGESIINALSGSIVTSSNALYCLQAGSDAAVVNIYDGATVTMNKNDGAAVTGVGIVNIYGGTITSSGWGVFTSSSGTPEFTISGGTITGAVGAVASCADLSSYSTANPSVTISGGTINGKISKEVYGTSDDSAGGTLAVTGGTFSVDPSAYLVEGCTAVKNSGTWTVTDNRVAAITKNGVTTKYATLQAAITATSSGDTVTLLTDVTLSDTLTIPADKTVTLDLNGCTITNETTAPITISGGNLTVMDSSKAQTGAIIATSTGDNDTKAAVLFGKPAGSFTLKSGKLQATKYGVRSATKENNTIVIEGGTIEAPIYGYGVYANSGSVTMNGGQIEGGTWGIAAYGNFTMTGGTIEAELGYCSNGTYNNSVAVIEGGTIKGTLYSGIYWPSAGNLTITGGSITGSSAVILKSGSMSVSGGTLHGWGEKTEYEYVLSGGTETGDALMIDNVGADGYEAITSVSITGGTFTSVNASAVGSYTADKGAEAVTGFVTGGTFSSEPTDYLAAGYKVVGNELYAVINEDRYLVTFNPNGGQFAEIENPSAPYTVVTETLLSQPSRSGYTFNGWYTEASGGTKVTSLTDDVTTVYAQWTKNASSSSSSSSSSSNTTSSTEKNSDGSTTTTTTNKTTGTVTETTKNTDGSTTTVVTEKDGTVTTTEKTSEGVTSTVVENEDGDVTDVSVTVPTAAAKSEEPVTLPVEVEAADSSDDAVEISVNVPSKGATVEIPVEDVTPGTVVVIVNADGTETIVPTTTLTEDGVVVTLDEDATIKVIDNSKDFTDVADDYALSDSIDFVSARGLFEGNTETTFNPHANTTVAQTMTVLARLSGEDFYGAGSTTKGAEWAEERGLHDSADIHKPITRQEMVLAMWRLAGMPMSDHPLTATDTHEISADALVAMQWAVENGILKGNLDGTINPNGNASRAHVAAFAERFVNAL